MTREDIEAILRSHNWNRSHVAEALGISPTTLLKKIREFGLE